MQHTADIKQLLEKTNQPILSLYLHVDPALRENQSASPAWRIWLKNALKELIEVGLSLLNGIKSRNARIT
jgi:hypothetical protein